MRFTFERREEMGAGLAPAGFEPGRRSPRGRRRVGVKALLIASVVSVGVTSGSMNASATARHMTDAVVVSIRTVPRIGTVLVNSSGRTLYFNTEEASGKILCTGACLGFWFPVISSSGATPKAAVKLPGKLSTVRRPGTKQLQVAYEGKPLYTFRLDGSAGQARGNDFTDHFGATTFNWRAVVTQPAKGTSPTATTAPAYGGNPGYNYSS